jgi:hypothetical protein
MSHEYLGWVFARPYGLGGALRISMSVNDLPSIALSAENMRHPQEGLVGRQRCPTRLAALKSHGDCEIAAHINRLFVTGMPCMAREVARDPAQRLRDIGPASWV